MSEKLAARLAIVASQKGVIPSEDIDLYTYSYQILIERTISWVCILIAALLFGNLYPYALVFIAFFIPLSMFTGGWHAPNFGLCFTISVGIFVGFSIVEPFITAQLPINVMMGIVVGCAVIVGVLGPCADANKPMDAKSIKRCHKISVVVLLIEVSIASVVFTLGNERVLMFIVFSFAIVGISLLAAHYSRKHPIGTIYTPSSRR